MPSRRRALTAMIARAAAASIADAARADAELASLYDQVVAATARTNEAGISHEEWAECCDDCDALAFRLCDTPTRTATGLAIKLRAFALLADAICRLTLTLTKLGPAQCWPRSSPMPT